MKFRYEKYFIGDCVLTNKMSKKEKEETNHDKGDVKMIGERKELDRVHNEM